MFGMRSLTQVGTVTGHWQCSQPVQTFLTVRSTCLKKTERKLKQYKLKPLLLKIGVLGLLVGAGLAMSGPAHAALTVYKAGNLWTGSIASSGTAIIRGGAVEGHVGGRANVVLRTKSVLGAYPHTTTGIAGALAEMSHSAVFDGKSQCYWYNIDNNVPGKSNWIQCQAAT